MSALAEWLGTEDDLLSNLSKTYHRGHVCRGTSLSGLLGMAHGDVDVKFCRLEKLVLGEWEGREFEYLLAS